MTDAGNKMENMIDGATTHLHPAYSYSIWGKKHSVTQGVSFCIFFCEILVVEWKYTQVGSPAVRLRLASCTAWVKWWSEAMDFFQTIFKTNISLSGIFENGGSRQGWGKNQSINWDAALLHPSNRCHWILNYLQATSFSQQFWHLASDSK